MTPKLPGVMHLPFAAITPCVSILRSPAGAVRVHPNVDAFVRTTTSVQAFPNTGGAFANSVLRFFDGPRYSQPFIQDSLPPPEWFEEQKQLHRNSSVEMGDEIVIERSGNGEDDGHMIVIDMNSGSVNRSVDLPTRLAKDLTSKFQGANVRNFIGTITTDLEGLDTYAERLTYLDSLMGQSFIFNRFSPQASLAVLHTMAIFADQDTQPVDGSYLKIPDDYKSSLHDLTFNIFAMASEKSEKLRDSAASKKLSAKRMLARIQAVYYRKGLTSLYLAKKNAGVLDRLIAGLLFTQFTLASVGTEDAYPTFATIDHLIEE